MTAVSTASWGSSFRNLVSMTHHKSTELTSTINASVYDQDIRRTIHETLKGWSYGPASIIVTKHHKSHFLFLFTYEYKSAVVLLLNKTSPTAEDHLIHMESATELNASADVKALVKTILESDPSFAPYLAALRMVNAATGNP